MNQASTLHHFRTRGYLPEDIVASSRCDDLDLAGLPPFLRTLLVTDGTVTKSLEAYFWEPVEVETLGQARIRAPAALPWLDLAAGAEVLDRRVRLHGTASGRFYAYARSELRLELLPARFRDDLLDQRIGIGELLRECGLETYREILDLGSARDPEIAAALGVPGPSELVARSYRIVLGGQPAILIHEYFPLSRFAGPAGGGE